MIAKRRFAVVDVRDLAHLPGPGTDRAEWSVLTRPEPLLLILDDRPDDATVASAAARLRTMPTVVVLVADPDQVPAALLDAVDLALTDADDPPTPWVRGPAAAIEKAVAAQPRAALALAALLRTSAALPVWEAVVAEASTYGMLLRSRAHLDWLATRVGRSVPVRADGPCVVSTRSDRGLLVELDRPEVHNAVDTALRDQLVDALGVAAADPSIPSVDLRGRGPSFSSGGDLHEFGSVADGATAFAVRLARHPGLAVHGVAERTTVHLHGACIGAGIELAAFAGRVVADPGIEVRLPEVAMGLLPGAGGTASITRRIGRQRCAWLALTGHPIHADAALAWNLIDAIEPRADWPA